MGRYLVAWKPVVICSTIIDAGSEDEAIENLIALMEADMISLEDVEEEYTGEIMYGSWEAENLDESTEEILIEL